MLCCLPLQWYGWEVTRILGERTVAAASSTSSSSSSSDPPAASAPRTEYYVKWRDRSYLHCAWVDRRVLLVMNEAVNGRIPAAITRFNNKNRSLATAAPSVVEEEDGSVVQLEEGQLFNPDYLQVHRIISRRGNNEYLVKWKGLGYEEATWESVEDIKNDAEIARYHYFSTPPNGASKAQVDKRVIKSIVGVRAQVEQMTFKGGRQLRDYQIEGVGWMAYNFLHEQPSLLADEMVATPLPTALSSHARLSRALTLTAVCAAVRVVCDRAWGRRLRPSACVATCPSTTAAAVLSSLWRRCPPWRTGSASSRPGRTSTPSSTTAARRRGTPSSTTSSISSNTTAASETLRITQAPRDEERASAAADAGRDSS